MSNDTEIFSAPEPLLIYGVVHCYLVAILGTLASGLVLWCIYHCQKTRAGVKVLLTGIFLPLLFISVTRPVFGEYVRGKLIGDPGRVPLSVVMVFFILYCSFAVMEILSIAVIAIFRCKAVCSPHIHTLDIGPAVAIVIGLFVYSLASTIGVLGMLEFDLVTHPILSRVANFIFFFFNLTMPLIVTLISYAVIMVKIRHNKRRLDSVQDSSINSRRIDGAMKAIFAVFVSNVVLGTPHSILHMTNNPSYSLTSIIIHFIYTTHFVLDPVVYIWFNCQYRERVRNLCSSVVGLCSLCFKRKHSNASVPSSTTSPSANV